MTKPNHADTLCIPEFLEWVGERSSLNAKSLISTFFGDLAIPHGGKSWVETITDILAPLGINNRLVRTSLFRLVSEEWLVSTRAGRKSFYQLTKKANSQTALAERLIYHRNEQQWNGQWTLVFMVMDSVDKEARRQLQQELAWIGFGPVAKHILAHPTASEKVVAERAKSLGMGRSVICMRASNLHDAALGLEVDDQQLAASCFPTADLETSYKQFIETFSRIDIQSIKLTNNNETELLALRMVLLDEYRRIVLHDPHLPQQLLPENWAGDQAYDLCKRIYQALLMHTETAYRALLANAGHELLCDADTRYAGRFID